jgi:hypothetical protein
VRLITSTCLALAASSLACRPVGDLDATRRGSSSVVASSDAPSSEPPTPTAPPTPTSPTATTTTAGAPPVVTPPVGPTAQPTSAVAPLTSDDETQLTESEQSTLEPNTNHDTASSSDGAIASSAGPETTPVASSEVSDATSPAPTCSSKCGLGETCEELTDCLSLRCDDVCQAMELTVESNGIDAVSTSIKMHVELYGDPAVAVAWQDLAVLYFVTVEKHDDFKLNFAQGGGTALVMQVTLEDWILVWTTDAAGNVPASVTPFDVQIHSYPWLPDVPESNDNSNDYSYREGLGPNDKIVLCRRIDGEWRHAQGTAPAHIDDPCQYVNNCGAALSCDPLEASPS